ncbi:MAG: DinB family protein [Candidatus Kapaibacterium sp.]|jgi:uncharacterized damage-inducible protein DinB
MTISASELIEQLEKTAQLFAATAKSYPRELVTAKPTEIAFSATEIVYHMCDVERLWQTRFAKLLDGSSKIFSAMNPDQAAKDGRYNEQPYSAGINTYLSARGVTITLIRTLTEAQLTLTGEHSRYGPLTILQVLEIMTNHDKTHAKQLERTLSEVRAES